MDSSLFSVSHEDFILFHKIDRDIYTILVTIIFRDPIESMQTLAMWPWLERVGFRNTVKKIMSLPIILINEVVDETIICLTCVNNGPLATIASSEANDIPLLQSLMDKEISLQFFNENRVKVIQGVAKVWQEVCLRACSDIMQQAMLKNAAEKIMETQKVVSYENNNFLYGSTGPSNTRLGGGGVPADARTLFVTFSKGYRVEERELREFFTMAYGDCIETLYMQEMQPNEQPLFARIVFHKVSTIEMILRGATKTKFSINGKHVWARKFVPKKTGVDRKNLLPSSLGDQASSSGFGQI